MKSYFLEALHNNAEVRHELNSRFPGQDEPWNLQTDDGSDTIAYLNFCEAREGECEGPYVLQADITGRHYNEDEKVIGLLRSIQTRLGGVIRDDFDNLL